MHKAECITPCRLRDVQSIARISYPSYLSHPILHRSILKPGLLTNWLTVRIFFLGHLQDQKINEFYCGVLHWLSFINLKFSTATVLPSSTWVCKLVMARTCKILRKKSWSDLELFSQSVMLFWREQCNHDVSHPVSQTNSAFPSFSFILYSVTNRKSNSGNHVWCQI